MLRTRDGEEPDKVSFIELFFDLVFVFAVTQISHSLMADFSARGMLRTLMLLLAVWWVWIFTAWVTNWLDPEKLPVRIALLGLMGLGLLLSASVPQAFGERGAVFAGAYVAMQMGRTTFFLWAVKGNPAMARTFQRILFWFALGGIFWIAGAFLADGARLACWGAALLVEYAAPSLGFRTPGIGKSSSTDWDVSGHHLAERCGLFIIVALGESVLVTGATFSGLEWTSPVIAAFLASVAGSMAMWWLYFDTASGYGTRVISAARNPGRLARLAYTYLHLFLGAGIILNAVADEFVLAHPSGHSSWQTVVAVPGGFALYLLGNLLFKRAISGRMPLSHLSAMAVLALLAPAGPALAPWLLMLLGSLVLCAVALWEKCTRCLQDSPPGDSAP